MLEFKTLTLKDKEWVDKIVMAENSPSADFNFGNMYIWNNYYQPKVCRLGDRMIVKIVYNDKQHFVYPIGSGSLKPAIEEMLSDAAGSGCELILKGVCENHKELLEAEFPGKFVFTEQDVSYDYIYLAEKLSTYSGKALHGKKNHCNRFEAQHDWEFCPITREILPECLDMLDAWIKENDDRLDPSVVDEYNSILRAFTAYEALGFEGGILRSDGHIIGFTMGEMINSDTFDVHFEKADININGAYPMVCRELCRMLIKNHPELKYINREDDLGLESLRRSKLSYKPEYILKKYTARWQDE